MTYSYSRIQQYVAGPHRYPFSSLESCGEKEAPASLFFGRVFERALGAYFRREDCGQVLHDQWANFRGPRLDYASGDTWSSMLRQGIQLLERFCQDDRVRIEDPDSQLQIKVSRRLSTRAEFVAYIDAIGQLDDRKTLIEWKTSCRRRSVDPTELLDPDPQLLCYSWMTGMADVALVVFRRKRLPEIQYLRMRVGDEQRKQYGLFLQDTISQIESAHLRSNRGIRVRNGDHVSGLFDVPLAG